MKEIHKENSKVSQNSNHDSIVDLKQLNNIKSFDQSKLLKSIKKNKSKQFFGKFYPETTK